VDALSKASGLASLRALLVAALAVGGFLAAPTDAARAENIDLTVDELVSQTLISILDPATGFEIDSTVTVISGSVPATRNAASWTLQALNLQAEPLAVTLGDPPIVVGIEDLTLTLPDDLLGVGLRGEEIWTGSGFVVRFDSLRCDCDDFRAYLRFTKLKLGQVIVNVDSDQFFDVPPEFSQPLDLTVKKLDGALVLEPTETLSLESSLDLTGLGLGSVDLIADLDLRLVPEPDSASLALASLASLALLARRRGRAPA
jgi:hypothetical protein